MNPQLFHHGLGSFEEVSSGVPMSNAQRKRAAAAQHNALFEEQQAVLQAQKELTTGLTAVESETNKLAGELLKSDSAWDVLQGLSVVVTKHVLDTEHLMGPLMVNLETEILPKLADPEAFKKNVQNVSKDLFDITQALMLLKKQHDGRTGVPLPEDLPLIDTVSLGYSNLQSTMERGVTPMLTGLIETMEAAGIDSLSVVKG